MTKPPTAILYYSSPSQITFPSHPHRSVLHSEEEVNNILGFVFCGLGK